MAASLAPRFNYFPRAAPTTSTAFGLFLHTHHRTSTHFSASNGAGLERESETRIFEQFRRQAFGGPILKNSPSSSSLERSRTLLAHVCNVFRHAAFDALAPAGVSREYLSFPGYWGSRTLMPSHVRKLLVLPTGPCYSSESRQLLGDFPCASPRHSSVPP